MIKGEYRDSWSYLNKDEIIEKENYFIYLVDLLLPKKSVISCSKIRFDELKNFKNTIIFQSEIIKRKPMHNHFFNINNIILNQANQNLKEKIFLKRTDFKNIQFNYKNYICWHIRYSEKWDLNRNISKQDFELIGNFLSQKFYGKKILIISDLEGCNYSKKLNKLYNFNLVFSSDYTNNFEGCANLILKSNFYFQYKGGGVSVIAVFSNIPYLICQKIKNYANEYISNDFKFLSIANKNQNFIDISKYSNLKKTLDIANRRFF